MSRAARRAAGWAGAALALLCVGGCGAYAPAHWPDGETAAETDADREAGEEQPDGA